MYANKQCSQNVNSSYISFRRASCNYLWDPDDSFFIVFEDTVLFVILTLSILSVLHMSRWGNFIPSQLLVERIIAILIALISPNSLKHRRFDTSDKSYVKVDRRFTVCSFHKFSPEYDRSLQYIYLTYVLSMRLVDNYKDHLLF